MNEPGSQRSFYLQLSAVLLLWLGLSLPLALGQETLYFRDVFSTHLPLKAFGAETLRHGEIPQLNPTWALGQPFRGNPNAVALYPGNLLYLWLPFWSAFNLHYVLHWLLAGVGMFLLARRLTRTREAALMAALAYSGSGWMLAALTFYNLLVVVSWWPWVILGAVGRGRTGVALGGLACGMALLGGEPVTALLGTVPLLLLAARVHGLRAGIARTALIGVGGVAVALPQLVATARITATSFRGAHGLVASQASHFSLEPSRLLELALPFPFGLPGWRGPLAASASGVLDHLPFYFSIHFGIVALVLALLAAKRQPLLSGLAGVSLLLAWLGGLSGETLLSVSGGLFRSPEKLLFWLALALPLMAAAGLDRLLARDDEGRTRWMLAAAAALAIAAVVVSLSTGSLPFAPIRSAAGEPRSLPLTTGLATAGALLALIWWLRRRRRTEWLVAIQLAALLQLAPLWMTDSVEAYRDAADIPTATDVALVPLAYPPWASSSDEPNLPATLPNGPPLVATRWLAAAGAPAPGILAGNRYPLAPDLEGMHHLFYGLLEVRLSRASWRQRIRWLEVLGVDRLVTRQRIEDESLVTTPTPGPFGGRFFVHHLRGALPAVWWPEAIEIAPTPAAAFELVAESPPASLPAVLPQPIEHRPGGRVEVAERSADRLRFDVESDGGLFVVQRAFQSQWRARIGTTELPVLPANLALTGIIVPAGRHRVTLEAGPDAVGVATPVSATAIVLLLGVAAWDRRAAHRSRGPVQDQERHP